MQQQRDGDWHPELRSALARRQACKDRGRRGDGLLRSEGVVA